MLSRILLTLPLLAAGALQAQTAGSSLPAAFATLTLPGTSGTAAASRFTFAGLPLTTPVLWQSTTTTAVTSGSSTLADSKATWTADLYNGSNGAHYVEVVSVGGSLTAAGVGTTYLISATGPKSLTLSTPLASGLTGTVGFRIRRYWTLAGVFGASNAAGLQAGTEATADLVLLPTATGFESYYYLTGSGWRKTGDSGTDAAETVIPPNTAVLVQRRQAADVSLTGLTALTGTLKGGLTVVPIVPGQNFVANPYGAAMTLASSGLYTGSAATGLAGGSVLSADQVLLWNGTGYTAYYYQTSGLGGVGWRSSTDAATDAGSTALVAGGGFLVRRLQSAAFTWSIPQHPSSL